MASSTIPAAEFHERQRLALADAEQRGLAGLLIWSRGGFGADFFGDVCYLANYYSIFPAMPDSKFWSGKSYTSLILPVEGDPVLLVDMGDWPTNLQIEDVRFANFLPETTAEVLVEK